MKNNNKWTYIEIMAVLKVLIAGLILTAILDSCNAVKKSQRQVNKVLNDPEVLGRVGAYWQYLHPCINDTSTKTVTKFITGTPIFKHDTLWRNGLPYMIRDSILVHDTIYLDKNHYITDGRQVRQLTDSLSLAKRNYADLYSAMIRDRAQYKQDITNEHDKTKAADKRGNRWMWKFWGMCVVAVVGTFHKLIFKALKLI